MSSVMRPPIEKTRLPIKSQQGVVLVTGLVFLVILTLLGITSLSTNTLEERMAANTQDINRAFQAAESGINVAFNSSNAFTGTTADYSSSTADTQGTYSATMTVISTFRTSMDVSGYQDIQSASEEGLLKWHYYDVRSTGATQSGATSVVGVGAKVLGQ